MITIDIETCPACSFEEFKATNPTIKMPKNYKVGGSAYVTEHKKRMRDAWLGAALDSSRGRIAAIAWTCDEVTEPYALSGPGECELLASFFEALVVNGIDRSSPWVTWYGEAFDLPWLRHRALVHRLPGLAQCIPIQRFQSEDVSRLWAGTDYRGKYRLADVARCLGIPSKQELPDGADVAEHIMELFAAGEYARLGKYAVDDVVTTRAIYQRITNSRPTQ